MFLEVIAKAICDFVLFAGHSISLMGCGGPFYQPKEPEDFNA